MLNSVIIGGSAQLAQYFPGSYLRISSRNIDYSQFENCTFDRVFILMAEHRTYLNESVEFYESINFYKTLEIVDYFKSKSNKIVLYSTTELWNNKSGPIDLSMPYDYNFSPYIRSKERLSTYIKSNKSEYSNVVIVYPVNFNSIYRKGDFLFGKVFSSILNRKCISVGNIDFNRDVIHPSIIVNISIDTESDVLIGSGELTNIKKYIIDLYSLCNLDYRDFITYDDTNNLLNIRKEYFSSVKYSSYEALINLTKVEIKNYL